MDADAIKSRLKRMGINFEARRVGSLSSKLIRFVDPDGAAVVAVGAPGAGGKVDDQVHALVDAVHWRRCEHPHRPLRMVLGSHERTREVLEAVSSLVHALPHDVGPEIQVDFEPQSHRPPCFADSKPEWAVKLANRTPRPPAPARELSRALGHGFRWYRNVTSGFWSGRAEGLEVCRLREERGGSLRLDVSLGSYGKGGPSDERREFDRISAGYRTTYSQGDLSEARHLLQELVEARCSGSLASSQPEHRLEARILRGDLVIPDADGAPLHPVVSDAPFQFPALWWEKGQARFIDALMRTGSSPVVVELKVCNGGLTQEHRHAITQAVLYRTFIKGAKHLHEWFKGHGLEPTKCEAIVAFPAPKSDRRGLDALRETAALFGVGIQVLPA